MAQSTTDLIPAVHSSRLAALLNPGLCANTEGQHGEFDGCQRIAEQLCGSCRLVQYCSRECQVVNWPQHKIICKSPLMKNTFVPAWIKEGRCPHWISDTEMVTPFGVNQYLWGNMPALNLLSPDLGEGGNGRRRDRRLLFAASGDLRNVVKTIVEGVPNDYEGQCKLVINDINFMVVARNAILLLIVLTFGVEQAAVTMIHVWYSALLPHVMMEALRHHVLGLIDDVCEKVRDKDPRLVLAKTFAFGKRSLRLVLRKHQWDELRDCLRVPEGLTADEAQEIRRRCMLAPERKDYLHRALCSQTAAMRVATMTFRENGLLLPHGASKKSFDTPNPTLFHKDLVWPMKDDANPLEGWDHKSYRAFAPKAGNDVMGSLFFYLKDMLIRFCDRVQNIDISFHLFNVDARALPRYLGAEENSFDGIEVSNICDRGYIGPERTLSTFSPLLASKAVNPRATLLMLFINAVSEVYHHRTADGQRFKESLPLMKKFFPANPATVLQMRSGGIDAMSTPEMIRLSSCYTMLGDFDRAFDVFLEEVQMDNLTKIYGMAVKDRFTIIEPWPLRITEDTSQEEFDIRCATSNTGSERYVEFERC